MLVALCLSSSLSVSLSHASHGPLLQQASLSWLYTPTAFNSQDVPARAQLYKSQTSGHSLVSGVCLSDIPGTIPFAQGHSSLSWSDVGDLVRGEHNCSRWEESREVPG